MSMSAVAVAVQPCALATTFHWPVVRSPGMVRPVAHRPPDTDVVVSTPVGVPGPTGVISSSIVVPSVPLPETVITPPGAAAPSLSTTPDGVYAAHVGSIVVVVVDDVVVVVVVVVAPPLPGSVQPTAASASPATTMERTI